MPMENRNKQYKWYNGKKKYMKIDNLNIKGNFNMNFLNATLCWREKNMLRGNNNLSKKSDRVLLLV